MPITDDTQAIQHCQQGDNAGIAFLIARYQAAALRLAFMLTDDVSAAEDIVQDSFLLAFRDSKRFEIGRPFTPWLMRIVTNQSRSFLRGARHQREVSLNAALSASTQDNVTLMGLISDHRADPVAQAEHQEKRVAIGAALALLTTKQREAVILRYYFGYSDNEIAVIVDCRPGAARQRLHEGLRALAKIITQHFPWLLQTDDVSSFVEGERYHDAV